MLEESFINAENFRKLKKIKIQNSIGNYVNASIRFTSKIRNIQLSMIWIIQNKLLQHIKFYLYKLKYRSYEVYSNKDIFVSGEIILKTTNTRETEYFHFTFKEGDKLL